MSRPGQSLGKFGFHVAMSLIELALCETRGSLKVGSFQMRVDATRNECEISSLKDLSPKWSVTDHTAIADEALRGVCSRNPSRFSGLTPHAVTA